MTKYNVCGFKNFMDKITQLEKEGKTVFCMFCGEKDAHGKSWCPDCVAAEPVVDKCLEQMNSSDVYVYCSVGGREYWKDKSNDFRVHPKLKLTGVPTLLKWGEPNKKLVEDQLLKPGLISMLLED